MNSPWRTLLVDPAALALPDRLVGFLEEGKTIVLAARYSTPSGKAASRQVHQGLVETADALQRHSGLSVHQVLPSYSTVVADLAEAEPVRSTDDRGRPFTNRVVVYDFRAQAQLVVVVSIGSGSKLDGKTYAQPFVERLAQIYRDYDGRLLFVKRLDRSGRTDWSLGPLMHAVEKTTGFLGDGMRGIRAYDEGESLLAFIEGGRARKDAANLIFNSRTGQRSKTGTEMVNGQASYHVGQAPPPGFGRATLTSGVGVSEKLLYLDTAACRPAPNKVAFGLAAVFDANRNPVDQVENVRWLLAHYGKPNWPPSAIENELVRRRFSTVGLRQLAGDPAAVADHANASQMIQTVIANLDVYETGVLRRRLGEGVDAIEITNCFPPDGPWASEKDFARIRNTLRETRTRFQGRRKLTFVSLTGTYDGTPIRLRTDINRTDRPRRAPRYAYRFPQGRDVKRAILIPAEAFHTSIIDALYAAGDRALPLAANTPNPQISHLETRKAELTHELESADARKATILDHLTNPSINTSAPLFRDLQDEYNTIAETTIPQLTDELHQVTTAIDDASRHTPAVPDANLLHLVSSLTDPTDLTWRHLWLKAITNLAFTTRRDPRGRRYLTWNGQLLIGDENDAYVIEFSGTHQPIQTSQPDRPVAIRTLPNLIDEHLAALRDGHPFPTTTLPQKRRVRPHLADKLGIPATHPLFTINDPTILRITVACLEQPDADDAAVAATTHTNPLLVARIRTLHTSSAQGQWQHPGERAVAALHAIAATQNGHVTAAQAASAAETTPRTIWTAMHTLRGQGWPWKTQYKRGYQLQPCACGSYRRAPLTIPEPDGPVCLNCRKDLAGILWPSDPYDTYIAYPELWGLQDKSGKSSPGDRPVQSV